MQLWNPNQSRLSMTRWEVHYIVWHRIRAWIAMNMETQFRSYLKKVLLRWKVCKIIIEFAIHNGRYFTGHPNGRHLLNCSNREMKCKQLALIYDHMQKLLTFMNFLAHTYVLHFKIYLKYHFECKLWIFLWIIMFLRW